jgi:NAD(P)-dependent dehydrogenase (short-subunit alcohol dehydrogenase family)
MARYLEGKVVYVIGSGSELHRGTAVALAEAGADVAVGGRKGDLAAEAALHSIANEIWALGRRSTVVAIDGDSPKAFAEAVAAVISELGHVELVVRCEAVGQA